MNTITKVAVGVIGGSILAMGGCAALVGGAAVVVSEGVKEAEVSIKADQAKNSITKGEFKALEMGASLKDVREGFGKPATSSASKSPGYTFVTLTYNVDGGDIMDTFILSFTNGTLDSKSKF